MPLSCQQIITRATTDASVPGYTSQAGDKLNLLLAELAELYDWDVLRSTLSPPMSVVAGTNQYSLPSNYLRARKVFYYINGQEIDVNMIPLEDWRRLFQGPGSTTYPTWGASDISPLGNQPATAPQLFLWPTPAMAISLNIMYYYQPADYANPSTNAAIPWFPYQNYLLKRLTADLMNSSAEKRKTQLLQECEAFLDKYGVLANDQEGFAVSVGKDPRRFRKGTIDARPTKQVPL